MRCELARLRGLFPKPVLPDSVIKGYRFGLVALRTVFTASSQIGRVNNRLFGNAD